MAEIVLLAFGAAVFPLLLACVAILISRPEPRRLLLAFYMGGMIVSVTCGILIVRLFQHGDEVVGSTASNPHPVLSVAGGVFGLLLAWLLASNRGRQVLDDWRRRHPTRRAKRKTKDGPSWVERQLNGASVTVAFAVGMTINLPGPLYLLALGDIATGGYSSGQKLLLIMVFNAIMFLMLEVPLIGYLVSPRATTKQVATFATWLNANGLRIVGWLVGVFSLSLLAQGLEVALS